MDLSASLPRSASLLRAVLACVVLALAGCGGGSAPVLAEFTRDWGDGRTETLELHGDGKVLMNHVGNLERIVISREDVDRLASSLQAIEPAADPVAYPRLTLTPAGRDPVVVSTSPSSAGALFLSLLDHHRLPDPQGGGFIPGRAGLSRTMPAPSVARPCVGVPPGCFLPGRWSA
jgi:hypothetical protein